MDFEILKNIITESIKEFKKKDAHLLKVNASERSMTHKIAIYIAKRVKDYDVDCEYNRMGELPKDLKGNRGFNCVYPDIIIHKRNTKENILVIKAKKDGNNKNDKEKIQAYLEDGGFKYKFGLLIDSMTSKAIKVTWMMTEGHTEIEETI